MVYTEVQVKGQNKYYYRTKSKRKKKKVMKERIYLGANLSKKDLSKKEKNADSKLNILDLLLNEKKRKLLEKIKKSRKKDFELK